MNHDDLVGLIADVSSKFVGVVVALRPEDWGRPGLGEWDVTELVGHTLRAFTTIDGFLDTPVDRVDVANASEYFRVALGSSPDIHAQVAARGRAAALELGDDPVAVVVEQVSATLGRLSATTGEEVGRVRLGGMALDAYLDTRLVELVVHLSDLCAAVGLPLPDLGGAELLVAGTVLGSATVEDRFSVLRAALGRESLPEGFNVWP